MPSIASHYRESKLWKGISNAWKHPIDVIPTHLSVADFAENGIWKIDNLQAFLPAEIILKLHAVSPPRVELEDDTPSWFASSNGEFQMKKMELLKSNASFGNVFMESSPPMKKGSIEAYPVTQLVVDANISPNQ
ncbi:ribonuclease H [Sesbania bispinosa]|nr:ribonuclease H [Sesbania bispinosa]